jgi:hypothetical protein
MSIVFPELERLISDWQSKRKRDPSVNAQYFQDLRDFFADIYEGSADDEKMMDLFDDLRWIVGHRGYTPEERARAMYRRFDIWVDT